MKIKKIISILIASILLIVLILFLFTYRFEEKIKILDCEANYKLEKSKPGYLDFSESNAKVEVANCLCEKYINTKEGKYKVEILKLYNEPFGGMRMIIKNPEKNIDTICKYRNEVFTKMHDM